MQYNNDHTFLPAPLSEDPILGLHFLLLLSPLVYILLPSPSLLSSSASITHILSFTPHRISSRQLSSIVLSHAILIDPFLIPLIRPVHRLATRKRLSQYRRTQSQH